MIAQGFFTGMYSMKMGENLCYGLHKMMAVWWTQHQYVEAGKSHLHSLTLL
jgi:hypothetical protein